MTNHRRLKIDTYKWVLAHLNPQKYGDKIQVDNVNDPLQELLEQFKQRNEALAKEPLPTGIPKD
jgi:hypothetical protein